MPFHSLHQCYVLSKYTLPFICTVSTTDNTHTKYVLGKPNNTNIDETALTMRDYESEWSFFFCCSTMSGRKMLTFDLWSVRVCAQTSTYDHMPHSQPAPLQYKFLHWILFRSTFGCESSFDKWTAVQSGLLHFADEMHIDRDWKCVDKRERGREKHYCWIGLWSLLVEIVYRARNLHYCLTCTL